MSPPPSESARRSVGYRGLTSTKVARVRFAISGARSVCERTPSKVSEGTRSNRYCPVELGAKLIRHGVPLIAVFGLGSIDDEGKADALRRLG